MGRELHRAVITSRPRFPQKGSSNPIVGSVILIGYHRTLLGTKRPRTVRDWSRTSTSSTEEEEEEEEEEEDVSESPVNSLTLKRER